MCLNKGDPQMMRIFSTDGTFHSVCANSGGGLARDGVLQEVEPYASRHMERDLELKVRAYARQ